MNLFNFYPHNLNNFYRSRNVRLKHGTAIPHLNKSLSDDIRLSINLQPYLITEDQLPLDITRAYRDALVYSHQFGLEYIARSNDPRYKTPAQTLIEVGLEPSLV